MTKGDNKTFEKQFDKSLREAFRILTRNERLSRHVEKARKHNREMTKKLRQMIREHPKDETLRREKILLMFDERALALQGLTVMNVEMALVYLLDFSIMLYERSSATVKDLTKLERKRQNVIVQTPKKYYKVLEAIKREIEASKRRVELAQKASERYIH